MDGWQKYNKESDEVMFVGRSG